GRAVARRELGGLAAVRPRERVDRALVAPMPGGAGRDRVALDRDRGTQAVAGGPVGGGERGRLGPRTVDPVEHVDGALVPPRPRGRPRRPCCRRWPPRGRTRCWGLRSDRTPRPTRCSRAP